MALHQVLAGGIIYADDVQDELDKLTPLAALKGADGTAFPSTTALANETGMSVSVTAGVSYFFNAVVVYDAGTVADIKLAWTFPSATFLYHGWGVNSAGAVVPFVSDDEVSGTAKVFGGLGIGTFAQATYSGFITPSASGTLQLQRAQSVSTAENTRIKRGTWMRLEQAV